eukprot:scaffold76483_cov19-Tisochrysis_lutea.AAC.4
MADAMHALARSFLRAQCQQVQVQEQPEQCKYRRCIVAHCIASAWPPPCPRTSLACAITAQLSRLCTGATGFLRGHKEHAPCVCLMLCVIMLNARHGAQAIQVCSASCRRELQFPVQRSQK